MMCGNGSSLLAPDYRKKLDRGEGGSVMELEDRGEGGSVMELGDR